MKSSFFPVVRQNLHGEVDFKIVLHSSTKLGCLLEACDKAVIGVSYVWHVFVRLPKAIEKYISGNLNAEMWLVWGFSVLVSFCLVVLFYVFLFFPPSPFFSIDVSWQRRGSPGGALQGEWLPVLSQH